MGRLHARLSRLSPVGAAALQNAVIVQEIDSRPPDMGWWNRSLVKKTTLKLCAEIQNSVEPAAFLRWTRRNRGNESSMAAFFCFCCWVVPHIPDDAEVGVYSRTLTAKVYRTAARRIPQMILVAAFGEAAGVRSMRGFMQLWEHAERTLSRDDFRLLGSLDERDHGPFLFWLLNERVWLPSAVLALRQSPASCLDPIARVPVRLFDPALGWPSFFMPMSPALCLMRQIRSASSSALCSVECSLGQLWPKARSMHRMRALPFRRLRQLSFPRWLLRPTTDRSTKAPCYV
jgi:hypothetical protein